MKQTIQIPFKNVKQKLGDRMLSIAFSNKYSAIYYLFILWGFISACIASYRYI